MKKISVAFVVLFALVLGACTSKNSPGSCTLNLAIWSNYAPAEVIQGFEKQSGCKIAMSNYSSNEELLAKLQAGAAGYDLAVPSDYMVFVMRQLGLLEPLDQPKVTAIRSELDPRFLKLGFDPANEYSLPYAWGTTGIAVNRTRFKGKITGWKDLLTTPELKGKVTMLDDSREVIASALRILGHPMNTQDPAHLEAAKKFWLEARGQLKGFTTEAKAPITTGETIAAQLYSVDTLQARAISKDQIEYIYPVEGGTFFVDNFVVPKGAPHREVAYQFINYMLSMSEQRRLAERLFAGPANAKAGAALTPELKHLLGLEPGVIDWKRFTLMEDLGQATPLWDRVWTEIKAGAR